MKHFILKNNNKKNIINLKLFQNLKINKISFKNKLLNKIKNEYSSNNNKKSFYSSFSQYNKSDFNTKESNIIKDYKNKYYNNDNNNNIKFNNLIIRDFSFYFKDEKKYLKKSQIEKNFLRKISSNYKKPEKIKKNNFYSNSIDS